MEKSLFKNLYSRKSFTMIHNKYCQCRIFRNKRISLKILAIHTLLMEIEQKISQDFEILETTYSNSLVNKFTFHCKIIIEPPGQLQKQLHIITECTIASLLEILKNYIGFNYLISLEMCDAATYEQLEADHFEKNVKTIEVYPVCLSYGKY